MSTPGPRSLAPPPPASWRSRRLHPDHSRGLRLTLAVGAAFLVVPFALLAILVGRDWPPLRRLDLAVTEVLVGYAADHPAWVRLMSLWTDVFAPMPLRVGALLLVVWLVRRGARQLAVWVAVTMAVGGLLSPLLKLLFGRQRPDLPDPVAQAPGLAFPSGHALNAALAAGVLLVVFLPHAGPVARRVVPAAALLLALVTGFSRVALGVHWTSDVLAGWLLGVAVVAATAAALTVWRAAPPGRPTPPTASTEPAQHHGQRAAVEAGWGQGAGVDRARPADAGRPGTPPHDPAE
ncbi:undecaprenyl-diphosphatase [Micromonospora citrea]|uniref:Undecaprenyl-diphosphatase n=1 Tax=Micromonospora citrea TaxID=47855 RepID=A0A1C6V7X0_9ACTN|nr:phosphatase PAP2 family protein [Micromonospora citrea]SCL62247.1 undecaprenyl-diphosphatase [Micromonospora citrea]